MAKLYVLTIWKNIVDSRIEYNFLVDEVDPRDLHKHCTTNSFLGTPKLIPTETGEPRLERKRAEVYEVWTDRSTATRRGEILVEERRRMVG